MVIGKSPGKIFSFFEDNVPVVGYDDRKDQNWYRIIYLQLKNNMIHESVKNQTSIIKWTHICKRPENIDVTLRSRQNRYELDLNILWFFKGNGVDAFEGDIMMTAEQYEELKKEFEQTGQKLPQH